MRMAIHATHRPVRRFWWTVSELAPLGRVSMDMLACDLTDLPNTGVDSPVVLWGEGLSADEVAAASGTISYELFCALACAHD